MYSEFNLDLFNVEFIFIMSLQSSFCNSIQEYCSYQDFASVHMENLLLKSSGHILHSISFLFMQVKNRTSVKFAISLLELRKL